MFDAAIQFGRYVHRVQYRKNSGAPYWTHTEWVACRVDELGLSETAIVTAVLHDTHEDQHVPFMLLTALFNEDVSKGVWWCSDQSKLSDGNRKIRKAIDREHYGQAPFEFKTVKLVDSYHNLKDIRETDPGFAPTYFKEKADLFEVLRDGHPDAVKDVEDLLNDYFNKGR